MPRQQPRFSLVIEIVLDSGSGKTGARISDISMGGCYVDTIAPFREGETIIFYLVQSGGRIKFTGDVSYVLEGFGFGVRFTNLTNEQTDFLTQVVSSRPE